MNDLHKHLDGITKLLIHGITLWILTPLVTRLRVVAMQKAILMIEPFVILENQVGLVLQMINHLYQ
jgi:hypothetical protein